MLAESSMIDKLRWITDVAHTIHQHLRDIPELKNGQVHFRPATGGVTMVGLLHERPQRGKGLYKAERLKSIFKAEFQLHCSADIVQGRVTPEKQLQSFLIGDAYRHRHQMQALQSALPTSEDTNLYFVTDEISVEHVGRKVVCDILAFNRCQKGIVPVLMELKSGRLMRRLVQQLNDYAEMIGVYQSQFEELFSALIGEKITFSSVPEKWLVWPSLPGEKTGRREEELRQQGIRVVSYSQQGAKFRFTVGQRPS